MSDFEYAGPADIDRAIAYLVALDDQQRNALAVIEIDQAIDEAQAEYEKATADASYRPSDDFLARLSGYLERADDLATP